MKNEELYLSIINNLCDGVYFVDLERKITFWNRAAEEITGYTANEIVGRRCEDNLLSHIDAEGRPLCIMGCPLYATMIDKKQRKEEVFLRHRNGHRIPILVNIFPMEEEGRVIGAIEIFTPNSPVVYDDDLVEQLSDMATKDKLTGLPNRHYLESYLDYKLSEYYRFHKNFAVLFLDIDNFSQFNNQYGHEVGDTVLRNIAASIKGSLRKADIFGRWGGEEFVGVFEIQKPYEAPIMAEKIRILVANTQVEGPAQLTVTASIGVTTVRNGDNLESIVERADKLMYESKGKGKNLVAAD